MNRTLERNPLKNREGQKLAFRNRLEKVDSFEEIPDLDDPVAERNYWKKHCIGKDLLDQVPEIEEDEG